MQLFLDVIDWLHCGLDKARARDDLEDVKIVRIDHLFEHGLVNGQEMAKTTSLKYKFQSCGLYTYPGIAYFVSGTF